ncbi:ABC transporter substrate-binding protein [Cohnella lupini]|uniref:Peptide/nickel transport system substrate-binding protein n=1 Tax=Cohnella lupini TaxID=1294267 RepID=A0A3D9HQH6_9BACL|nr:ABC transporter substrate-binding protein [Cohnella lupini]RED51767.1 peptide/nickel transport system substrate-binding protein [Cohnella lupini]
MLRKFTILPLLLIVLVLGACSKAGNNGNANEAASPSPSQSASSSPVASQSAGNAVPNDETLKVALGAGATMFDPGYGIGIASIKVFYNIFDTLLTTNKEGKIVGQLAESYDWVDDKTLEVKIRDGVTFQNGEPCTAEDVKFTFDRFLNGYGDGTVKLLYDTLESVEVVDDLTVRFKTKIVDSSFLERLGSIWGASIVPKDYLTEVGDEAFKTKPIGTGPYQMTSYSPEKYVLTRYDGFWGDAPAFKNIEMIVYPEASARMTALINGEVDIINDVTADMVDSLKSNKGINVVGTPIKNIHIYVFNTANGPMANEKFRQALTIGMNRQLMVDTLWGEYAKVPNGHQFDTYASSGTYVSPEAYPGIQFDVEKAKQLVKESGYDGTEIEIEMSNGYYMNGNQAGEAIVDMWKDIGVNAKVVYKEKLGWDFKHVRAWSSASRFDSPLGAMWLLFGPGSGPAVNSWLDMPADFKEAGQKLTETNDPKEKLELSEELLKMFDTYAPGTYLYQAEDYYGIRDGLDWDMFYAQNQITPFRAADLKLK